MKIPFKNGPKNLKKKKGKNKETQGTSCLFRNFQSIVSFFDYHYFK